MSTLLFFFNDTATTEIYTLSLPDALPIAQVRRGEGDLFAPDAGREGRRVHAQLSGNHGRRAARYRAADHDHVPRDHRAGVQGPVAVGDQHPRRPATRDPPPAAPHGDAPA